MKKLQLFMFVTLLANFSYMSTSPEESQIEAVAEIAQQLTNLQKETDCKLNQQGILLLTHFGLTTLETQIPNNKPENRRCVQESSDFLSAIIRARDDNSQIKDEINKFIPLFHRCLNYMLIKDNSTNNDAELSGKN